VGKPNFGDDHNFFTVRADDLKTHPNIIGNQMFAAPPAFEEDVGHLPASVGRVYGSMATKESRKLSPFQPPNPTHTTPRFHLHLPHLDV
jgi:hypothetical protein